jgi:HSP20 family molecular chaperone IbpA
MSRISLFNSPLLLGFEHFEQALDRISKTASDGYPPYDVEQIGENRLRITLAVAGFTLDDLQVQIKDNQLVIHGRRHEEAQRAFLHRGIAARQFHRNFVLAEGIEVSGASLVNGLLHIDLERPISEPTVKKIEVVAGPGESTGAARIDGMEKEE